MTPGRVIRILGYALTAIFLGTPGRGQDIPHLDRSIAGEYRSEDTALVYRLFLPPGYENVGDDYPLVLYLHGSGDWGNDNQRQLKDAINLIHRTQSEAYPAFLLAPQTPTGESWTGQPTLEIIDQVARDYRIDPQRIYVTGFSMGGAGTYDVLRADPARFAAAAPIAGATFGDLNSIGDVPIWIWHDASDGVVHPQFARDAYARLRAAGGAPLLTETLVGDHQSDQFVQDQDAFYRWMFAHSLPHPQYATLVEEGAQWKYQDTGANPGTEWMLPAFDDSRWSVGRGQFGYGEQDEATVVHCGPSAPICNSGNYPTTFFRHEFQVDSLADIRLLTGQMLHDDGAVVYLNGVEVFRDRELERNRDVQSYGRIHRDNGQAGIVIDPALLVQGRNVLAVELRQASATSSDLSFDMSLMVEFHAIPEPGVWWPMAFMLLAWSSSFVPARARADDSGFRSGIARILTTHCVECHNGHDRKGGLDLTSRESALRGGESGLAILPGDADKSLIYSRVAAGEMPPASSGKPRSLPAKEIGALRAWLNAGAPWPDEERLDLFATTTEQRAGLDWWSLRPVERPAIPAHRATADMANPIDAFVLEQLAQRQMTMAPRADRRTLIRRLYFDLIGLPPTAETVEAFAQDNSPLAYERLVDQLLASPHYGERWARYWLDVVRFAETCGYERDQLKPHLWRYRDWVIDAFNRDLPYDRFIADQLAGDEVPWRDERSVVATGMLRAGTWNDEPNDPADYLYERLEDMVHTTTTAFIGLTVKCARCHDHKFDPIRQTDYYRLASFFWIGYVGQANLGGPTKEELGYDVCGWTDRAATVEPIHLLVKGERNNPADVVEPGFLSAIGHLDRPIEPPSAGSKTSGRRLQLARWLSDRHHPLTARVLVNRLWQYHFGEGLVRTPDNFGFKGELPTHPELLDWLASELMGPVSQTAETAAGDNWSMKRIQRLIVLSTTYRQASTHPDERMYRQADFANRWLWRQNRRRLDAEALRDALLAACGSLNTRSGGPSFYPQISAEALEGLSRKENDWMASDPAERARRSIYMMTKRSRLLPIMTTFDFTDTTLPCGKREVTTVPTQALALLNNPFVHEQSERLAHWVLSRAPDNITGQIVLAWQNALGRNPTADEQQQAELHLTDQARHFAPNPRAAHLALASLCHVLLNTNELMYID